MKKIMLTLFAASLTLFAFSQTSTTSPSDTMVKHSGEVLVVKVIKVDENTITYKYPGEDAEQTIGKLAVASITYGGSGRKEAITDKVVISGPDDWENVQIITDPAQVLGLKAGEEVVGKTSGMLSYNTAGSADKKATKKLKVAAATAGAPFVLLTSDKSDGYGVKQSIKNGVLYSYK
jgi:hypothetical protein